jgi:Uma2 family endonuclease
MGLKIGQKRRVMALPTTKLYTVEEFETFIAQPENRDQNFELINGVIVEKAMPTEEHTLIVGVFLGELYIYARSKGIGLPGPEHRFKVPGDTKNTRQPDISRSYAVGRMAYLG